MPRPVLPPASAGRLPVVLLCLLLLVTATASADDARALLAGSWDLVSVENRGTDGSVVRPFGDAPQGRITYTADGYLSAHVMRAARAAFAGATLYGGSAEEKSTAYDSYIAYYGSYVVDPQAGTVTHRIEGSLFPNWSGSAQTRFYTLAADTLTLSTPPFDAQGKQITVHVVWRRAPALPVAP